MTLGNPEGASILKPRSTKYNPVLVKTSDDGSQKPRPQLKHLKLFSTKHRGGKGIRFGGEVGSGVGTRVGDRLGLARGVGE